MSSEEIDKFFNEVPNTAGPPVKDEINVPLNYTDVSKVLDDIAFNENIDSKLQYRAGLVIGKVNIKKSSDLLELICKCYIEALRSHIKAHEDNEDEKTKNLAIVSNYEQLINQTISIAKDLNFNIDHGPVLAIIHGAVTELTRRHLQK